MIFDKCEDNYALALNQPVKYIRYEVVIVTYTT